MATRTSTLPADVLSYMRSVGRPEPQALAGLRAATAPRAESVMQIGVEQGQLMALLVRLIGAKRCIEIGVYTGYSALAVAMALPADGKLIACDVSEEFTSVGRPFWREAGVDSRIDLRIQPALLTLDALLQDGAGTFDFAFIDADKTNYPHYYERLLKLIRRGGLIAVDNTLALSGTPVIHMDNANAQAVKAFNAFLARDERVDLSMLPIGEGLTLLRVR